VPTTNYSDLDPRLTTVQYNLNYGNFSLQFDRFVNASSFDISNFFLILRSSQNISSFLSNSSSDDYYRILSFSRTFNRIEKQGNATSINLFLPSDDYAVVLYYNRFLGGSLNDSLVFISRGLVRSSEGYSVRSIDITSPLNVEFVKSDSSKPYLKAYMLDMNLGILSLEFSEPMDNKTFKLDGVGLQSTKNSLIEGQFVPLNSRGSSFVNMSDFDRRLDIKLGSMNLNAIKSTIVTCSEAIYCYLSLSQPFIVDYAGNNISLIGIDRTYGLPVKSLTADVSPPIFISWSMDIDSGVMDLEFDETVYAIYTNYSAIQIVNENSTSAVNTSMRLVKPIDRQTANVNTITIKFTEDELNQIKSIPSICHNGDDDCYLTLEYGAVADVALIQNVYEGFSAHNLWPQPVSSFVPDTTRPRLLFFELNLDSRTLHLHFSETMNVRSIKLSQLTLQSSPDIVDGTDWITLSDINARVITTAYSRDIEIYLEAPSYTYIRRSAFLAKSLDSTFLSMKRKFITDMAYLPNRVHAIDSGEAIHPVKYYPDYSRPELTSWSLDSTVYRLNMSFSGPLDISSIKVDEVSLRSTPNQASELFGGEHIQLSSGSYVRSSYFFIIQIQLSADDISKLQGKVTLCRTTSRCYISFPSSFASSPVTYSNNSSSNLIKRQVTPASYLALSEITADSTGPALVSFQIDLNKASVLLRFDKVVDVDGFNISAIRLSQSNSNATSLRLTESSSYLTNLFNSPNVMVKLGYVDHVAILEAFPLGSSINTTYLRLEDFSGHDVTGAAIQFSSATQAKEYSPDTSPPNLLANYLDYSAHLLYLYFSRPIDLNAVDLSSITIIATNENSVNLSACSVTTVSSNISSVLLIDLSSIASTLLSLSLAQSQASTFIFLSANGSITSTPTGIPNLAVTASKALQEGNNILSVRLDLTSNSLDLELVIPMTSFSSITLSYVLITSTAYSTSYRLTSYNSYDILDNRLLRIYLSSMDSKSIQSLISPVKNPSDVVVHITSPNFLVDSNGKSLSTDVNLPCSKVTRDSLDPSIASFSLDLNTGVLIITFSEVIIASTIDMSKLALVNSQVNSTKFVNLATAVFTYTASAAGRTDSISISLNSGSPSLKHQILATRSIGRSLDSTYLLADDGFAGDTSYPINFVLRDTSAVRATTLIVDSSSPILLSFDLDLTASTLTLNFNKDVNILSNKPSYYYLLSDAKSKPTSQRNLITTTTINSNITIGTQVQMKLGMQDVDYIKKLSPSLCYSSSNCYLAVDSGAITDLSSTSNQIQQIFFRYAIQVSTFIADKSKPQLTSFAVDLDQGYLDMAFDERILCLSSDPTQIILQSSIFIGKLSKQSYQLTSSYISCNSSDPHPASVRVILSTSDVTAIKASNSICKSQSTTCIRLLTAAFTDTSGNAIASIADGQAIVADSFVKDITSPKLLSFSISSFGTLTLHLNEPISVFSIKIHHLAIQNHRSSPTKIFRLDHTKYKSTDSNKMVFQFNLGQDFSAISTYSKIFSNQGFIYLSVNSSFATDINGNDIIAIPETKAMQIGPAVVAWNLNLSRGTLRLTFSENVISSFSIIGISLRNSMDVLFNVSYNISHAATSFKTYSDKSIDLFLSSEDLNAIKVAFPNDYYRLYLTAPAELTSSTTKDSILPNLHTIAILPYAALPIQDYIPDRLSPILLSFNVDLNLGLVDFLFDEAVQLSTLDLSTTQLVSVVGTAITLSSSENTMVAINYTLIQVVLTTAQQNILKLAYSVSPINRAYVTGGMIYDYAGSLNQQPSARNPVKISTLIEDTTSPVLESLIFDLKNGQITIAFDEPVRLSYLSPLNFTILSSDNTSDANSFSFSLSTVLYSVDDKPGVIILDMSLNEVDSVVLGFYRTVATNINNSFLLFPALEDLFGNSFDSAVYQATSYIPDDSLVKLVAFDVDQANETIILYFSKAIIFDTFNCSVLKFSSTSNGSNAVTLAPDDCYYTSHVNDTEIMFSFASTSALDSFDVFYISISANSSVRDIYGNELAAIPSTLPLRAGPVITKWLLDINRGLIVLSMSKTIKVSYDFNISAIAVYPSALASPVYLSSSGSILVGLRYPSTSSPVSNDEYSSVIGILFSDTIINTLKYQGLVEGVIALIAHESFFVDEYDQPVVPISPSNRLLVSIYEADDILPEVLNVTLNLGAETIAFQFSEPIDHESLTGSTFALHSGNDSVSITATNVNFDDDIASTIFTAKVTLSKAEAAAIKLSSISSTPFITWLYETFKDTAGNFAEPVYLSNSTSVRLVADSVAPSLSSFDLDMNLGELVLYFSEPISVTSISPSNITIQSRFFRRDGVYYQLSGGNVSLSNDSTVVMVSMLDFDILNIKQSLGLARSRRSSYLTATNLTASDLAANAMNAIYDGVALLCSTFVIDSTLPKVLSMDLDVDGSTITLKMSEPILLSSVYPRALTFTSLADSESRSYTLSSLSYAVQTVTFDSEAMIRISSSDLNAMKTLAPLLSSASQSAITFLSSLMTDVYGNSVQALLSPQTPSTFRPDTTSPQLSSYSLDMAQGLVTLQLNEAVNMKRFNFSLWNFQNIANHRFGKVVIASDSSLQSASSGNSIIIIKLSSTSLNQMKAYGIGKDRESSFLAWSKGFVTDYANNPLVPRYDASVYQSSALLPTTFVSDNLAPQLLRWYLDAASTELLLVFNEPIVLLDITGIRIAGKSLMATTAFSYEILNSRLAVSLSDQTCSALDDQSNVCNSIIVSQLSTAKLSIASHIITDLAANPNYLFPVNNMKLGSPG
jgi:hypothetical protein